MGEGAKANGISTHNTPHTDAVKQPKPKQQVKQGTYANFPMPLAHR
jgi:hypothetical protein